MWLLSHILIFIKMKKENIKFQDRNISIAISRDAHKLLEDYQYKHRLDSLGKALDRILFQKK